MLRCLNLVIKKAEKAKVIAETREEKRLKLMDLAYRKVKLAAKIKVVMMLNTSSRLGGSGERRILIG